MALAGGFFVIFDLTIARSAIGNAYLWSMS